MLEINREKVSTKKQEIQRRTKMKFYFKIYSLVKLGGGVLCHMQMFLVLQPGIEPVSSAVNMQSPNQRPTKEFPKMRF